MDKEKSKTELAQDALKYSGVAINEADNDKADEKLVKERTKTLNNNPRNNDL